MSRSLRKRLAGALAVGVIAGGSLTLAAGEASADSNCNAPVFTACVQIKNRSTNVNSIRITAVRPNGRSWNRCLTGTRPGRTSTYSNVWFSGSDRVSVTAYTGGRCEGWSKTDLHASWSGPTWDQWWVLHVVR